MSTLYTRFLEEREEILRHKWIASEQQGYDIGFEQALIEWCSKYRNNWIHTNITPPTVHSVGAATHHTSPTHQ